MNDRIRISDADRERVAARLRDHYAEGRLSSDELDERITATLSAKTVGDLRRVMADLPDDAAAPMPDWRQAPSAAYYGPARRRGPRILPLALLVLIVALAFHGVGWLFFALLNIALLVWLVACVAGIFALARFRRHVRRNWHSGGDNWRQHQWRQYQWRG